MTKNFEDRYLDLLESGFAELKREVQANTKTTNEVLTQAKYTNGRVTKLEKRMAKVEGQKWRKLNLDPKILYPIAVSLMILLAIFATKMGINVKGWL